MSRKDIPFSSRDGARPELSPVWSWTCNSDPILDILVSPKGVVSVAVDSAVYLYAGAPSFGAAHTISLSPARLTAYAFSADGTRFLTGDSQGFVKWWEVHNGEECVATQFPYDKPIQSDEELPPVTSIAATPLHDLVAAAAGNSLCIYGRDGERLLSIGPLDAAIQCLEWKKPDELAVNTGSAVCMIHVTPDRYTLRQKYPNELEEGDLKILACSPKGTMFAAGCTTGLVQIWDLASESNEQISILIKGLPNASMDHSAVQCLEWDATARFLAAAGGSDVIVWDMQDTGEKEEGKDNSIVCYGHGKQAKITALSFQPKGHLLATGGDDCQVLVFDSSRFTDNGVVGGLMESLVTGKMSQQQSECAITALAWHPSGLILAGTNHGMVDAFEVSGAIYETPRAAPNGTAAETPFLITKANPTRRAPVQKPSGWGGEPLMPVRPEDGAADKGYVRRRVGGSSGNMGGVPRSPGAKPKVYMGSFKQQYPRPPHAEPMGNPGAPAGWPPMMHPQAMMRWPGLVPQQMPPPYPPQSAVPAPHPETQNNPPHTPESNSSEGAARGIPPSAPAPPPPRNDRPPNRNGHIDQGPPVPPTGPPPPYPTGFMPYPAPYPMGYPMPPYCYPYQMPPHVPAEGMHAVMPGYGTAPFVRPPTSHQPKGPMHQDSSGKSELPQKEGSGDVEEDLGSKSSEAVNNGVNHSATPHSEASHYFPDGRQNQGQTLYVGNLAPAVEDTLLLHLFSAYGPVVGVQVIRERETRTSRGFGFVTFAHPYYAQIAMDQLDSVQIQGPFEGRKLKVSLSNRR